MTKPRAPLTFPAAIALVGGVVGYAEIARLVGRSDRAVRYWSEEECQTLPSLDQAKALDLAYRAAGGEGFPILESYALQLQTEMAVVLADQAALAADLATAALEHAEAFAASVAVTQPGVTVAQIYRAVSETEQASSAITRLLARLKSFRPGNRAGERAGVSP